MSKKLLQRSGRINRRKFLTGVGAGVTAGLAGCGTDDPGQEGTTEPGDDTTAPDDTTQPDDDGGEEPSSGGKPVIGLAIAPDTLNPLVATTTYSFYIIDRIWSPYSVANHPNDQSFQPWYFTDWELNEDNIDSSDPTFTAELRDDLTFTDGEALTAEDFQFSAEYFKENNPAGSYTGAAHQNIDEVGVDSADGTTVSVYMSEPDQRWLGSILGYPILPKHIWEGVDDYTEYSPRDEDELIGAGAWELVDYDWENWFDFDLRDDWNVASADYVDWLDDGAPFVDGLRFEIFGSRDSMEQAILDGEIDGGFASGGFSINNAIQAEQSDDHTVLESQDAGYNHVSFNLRRVPFDDIAFRQFLVKCNDTTWIVEDPYEGIGAIAGDYAVPPELEDWRPPSPTEADEFEGIPLPDLEFPGSAGSFDLSEDEVMDAREFLTEHSDAEHEYSFEEGDSDAISSADGLELFVNGEPLEEAHTNNDGEGGQGPLQFMCEPPQEDTVQARTAQQFVSLMQKIGVPMEQQVQTFNSMSPAVYLEEDFDLYSMGWGLTVDMTHFAGLYSSEQADLDSSENEVQMFNAMGYTGADDLIADDLALMDFDDRAMPVKKIQAQMWHDAPTDITEFFNLLEPTTNAYEGWIEAFGGSVTEASFLNIRQA